LWLAANPSKRWAEVFFLAYSPFWIAWALCILVPFQLYEVGWLAAMLSCGRPAALQQQHIEGGLYPLCISRA
jgi:cycloeucalenol cycloisomerase